MIKHKISIWFGLIEEDGYCLKEFFTYLPFTMKVGERINIDNVEHEISFIDIHINNEEFDYLELLIEEPVKDD